MRKHETCPFVWSRLVSVFFIVFYFCTECWIKCIAPKFLYLFPKWWDKPNQIIQLPILQKQLLKIITSKLLINSACEFHLRHNIRTNKNKNSSFKCCRYSKYPWPCYPLDAVVRLWTDPFAPGPAPQVQSGQSPLHLTNETSSLLTSLHTIQVPSSTKHSNTHTDSVYSGLANRR